MINDETTYRLLRLLKIQPDISQRRIATELGFSLGKVSYCMKALIARGWVKAGNFGRSPNKARYAYLLTPAGVSAKARVTRRFLRRKMAEYDALLMEIEQLRRDIERES